MAERGKVKGQCIVTGGSRGIGAAIAHRLVERGWEIACLSRSGTGPAGRQLACDITSESDVRSAISRIAEWGPITALVNNAGVHIGGAAAQLPVADFNQTLALNVTAVMVACREAYPYLRKQGGAIVNIGSMFDKMGVRDNLAYCASKAAVAAMTRVLAVEWADDGISVVNVAPGYIRTDLNKDYLAREKVQSWMKTRIPAGGPGNSDDVGRLVASILSESISFLTGETIYIDGAQGVNH